MNFIFATIFILSATTLTLINPNEVLKAMTDGATKGTTLCLGLISIYTVWSGILQVAEDAGLLSKLSRFLSPIVKRLFRNTDEKTREQITVNLSANLLGMGGIATPSGIEATTRLTESGNHDGACLLFILASTSLQILPTTIISIRQSFGSINPFNIFLPSLISTSISTGLGILLHFATKRIEK